MPLKNDIEKILSHSFCANSIEVVEDENVLVLTARVLDFKPSPNGWGITEEVCRQHMNTIIGKHMVTKYYADTDTLGGHEDSKQKFRLGNFDIPHKETNSIGTIIDVWIDYIDKDDEELGKAMYVKCTLMVLEHLNEVTLIQEWLEQGIKVRLSVEWFYTTSVVVDGVEWIADPVFSNICVLNSESKNGKPIVYGNYDVAELGINLLDEMNNAILKDYEENSKNNKEGENKMNNRFLEALNGISVDALTTSIYMALSTTLGEEEYYNSYVYDIYADDKFVLVRNYNDAPNNLTKYSYSVLEDGSVVLNEGAKVLRQDVFVPIATMNEKVEEVNAQLNEVQEQLNGVQEQLDLANEVKEQLETKISTLEANYEILVNEKATLLEEKEVMLQQVNELAEIKEQQAKREYEEKLNEKIAYYATKFEEVGETEKFNSEEIQGKIKDMLNSDELVSLRAENEVNKFLLEKRLNAVTVSPLVNQGLNSNMDNLIPKDEKSVRLEKYGF